MKSEDRPAIIATDVGKRYRRYGDRAWTFQELVVKGLRGLRSEPLWGLRNVSFSVEPGQTLGVIGCNGSGKSTLLRLLAGISKPDEGRIQIHGGVRGLLALGAGFNGDLTGRENIFVAGVIGGATRAEVARRFDAIVNFAEIRDFIDAPVRTYSSGMSMRLAFAVAVHAHSGILLVDEVLAVGDAAFQDKCLRRIAAMKREGTTIVLVSHDTATIRDLSDQVLWLDGGLVKACGPATEIVDQYLSDSVSRTLNALEEETRRRTPTRKAIRTRRGAELDFLKNRFGSQEVEILDVRVIGPSQAETAEISSGDPLTIEIDYRAAAAVRSAIFSIAILDAEGRVWLHALSDHDREVSGGVLNGFGHTILWVDGLSLPEGSYWIETGIYERSWAYAYDRHHGVYSLAVRGNGAVPQLDPPLRAPTRWFRRAGELGQRRLREGIASRL
jgi:lipopolysaccharide transport system ATP-binding protein